MKSVTILTLGLLLSLSATGASADIYVPDDYTQIQVAINAAVDGDRVIVKSGTYYESIDFKGKKIIVKSESGPMSTVIKANGYNSVVTFGGGENRDTVLDGFTITGGGGTWGGGVYCVYYACPIIQNNIITNNKAEVGGGIYCYLSSAVITNNQIIGNNADAAGLPCYGGGICCQQSRVIITDNDIFGNGAINSQQAVGGGLYCTGNSAPLLSGNHFYGNRAHGYGGAIFSDDCKIEIRGNRIEESSASVSGGAIYCYMNSPIMENTIVYNNSTTADGGGIYLNFSNALILNLTVYGNHAGNWGGGMVISCCSPIMGNTIVWVNDAPNKNSIWETAGSYSTIDYCDIEGGWTGAHNINAQPLFFDAADGDFHLSRSSPCRNTGINAIPYLAEFDIEGDPRIAENTVDMGADEHHTRLYSMGDVVPASRISIRVVGLPDARVRLALGDGIQYPPLQTYYGPLYLTLPLAWVGDIGQIPAWGIRELSVTVPTTWSAGEVRPLQALVGDVGSPGTTLTNLLRLEVE